MSVYGLDLGIGIGHPTILSHCSSGQRAEFKATTMLVQTSQDSYSGDVKSSPIARSRRANAQSQRCNFDVVGRLQFAKLIVLTLIK